MREFLSQKATKLILVGEKYVKTDIRYLVKGSFWLLSGQGLVFTISLVLTWAFANLVDKDVYGQYRFLVAVAAFLGLTALPGANISLISSVAQGASGSLHTVLAERIKWSLLGTLIGLGATLYYYWNGDLALTLLFALIAFANPLLSSFSIYSPYLNGLKDFRGYAITHIIQRSIVVLPLLAALLVTQDIFILICVYLASTIIAHIGLFLYVQYQYPPNSVVDPEAVPYAKKLSLLVAAREGAQYVDKLFLWYLAGPVQVAMYAIALAMPQEIFSALSKVGILALPKMANRSIAELRENLLHKATIFFMATIPVTILYYWTTPMIFKILFPQYLDTIIMAQMAGFLILTAPIVLFTQYFNATKQVSPLYIIQISTPVVFVIALLILVPLMGPLGAVMAMLAKSYASFFLHLFFFLKPPPAQI